ncbi:hypothetical protein C8R45DRAFT_990678 [Mycena sanguinolenta]|nr:hypothetical protein C8R45DRAFT_990678 [Mycena sanguinolenta]
MFGFTATPSLLFPAMSGSPGLLYREQPNPNLTCIFIAILYAAVTFYMVYAVYEVSFMRSRQRALTRRNCLSRIPHTTQKDNDPVSRLNKQFVIINFLLLCWVLSIGLVPLTVSSGIKHTIAHCAEAWFLSPRCLTIGLDMVLPFALIGTRAYPVLPSANIVSTCAFLCFFWMAFSFPLSSRRVLRPKHKHSRRHILLNIPLCARAPAVPRDPGPPYIPVPAPARRPTFAVAGLACRQA